jgi:flavin-dependent dehydrogenase
MPTQHFDAVIVGARCAGAPLAVHLARAGQKVLLLDASKLPSDQPLSTHFVSPVGVEWLDELGVGADVRRLSPASRSLRLEMLGTGITVPFARGRAGHCLRRLHLDRLLQDAAVRAGAVLRDQTKVVALLREDGRVVGVEAVHAGVREEIRARVVVAADGRNSTVADLAGAEEYLGYDSPRFGYWAYWPMQAAWRDPARAFDSIVAFADDKTARLIFQTDGDLLLIGVMAAASDLPRWRGRYEQAYLEALRASPVTAPHVEGNERQGNLVGMLSLRFFFRRAAGPGFALVGDAGLHKDPTPGLGITDALRDAKALARAILVGSDQALVHYWRQRDVDSIDLFHFAQDMGDPGYVNALNRLVYERARESPEVIRRMARQADREISPFAVLPTTTLLRWVAGATLRGDLPVLSSFLTTGKRSVGFQRLRREREALLDAGI